MNRGTVVALAVAAAFLIAAGAAWFSRPETPGGGSAVLGESEPCGHDHATDPAAVESAECGDDHSAEHEHGEGPADLAMSMDEILSAECEHGVPTHRCDECRYEVGVVKVDESLMKEGPSSREGLIGVVPSSRTSELSVMLLTGEVSLEENRTVRIRPRISGILRSVPVDIGAVVAEGDVLFEIESKELGRLFSEYERDRAMTDLARRNFEREKGLFEKKISSEWDMIESQMAYEENKTELRSSETALRVLGLSEDDVRASMDGSEGLRMGRLPIRSPIAGTVIEKHAVVGERADEEDDVMRVADLGTVWVWADVYEQDLEVLLYARRNGPVPVEVSVHAFPGRTFAGEIDYVGDLMQEQTRTVKVRATVDNEEQLLRPGMFCEIRVVLGAARVTLSIPREALLSDEGVDFIFKHLKDDFFVRRAVTKGREFEERVEITAGLDPDDLVVAGGAFLLKSDVLRSKMGAG